MLDEPVTPPVPGPRRVAAFDFDGTLVRRDTLIPFLAKVAGARGLAVGLAAQASRYRQDRDAAKVDLLRRLLAGRVADTLETFGRDYAVGLHHLLRPEMAERLRWHRREGHELVIVSASLGYYLRPVGATLGFDAVIGVEMAVGDDGRLTGELVGPNVRGEEKARRLRAWLADRPAEELWAYGNSSGDDALLALADHPKWLGRRARQRPR